MVLSKSVVVLRHSLVLCLVSHKQLLASETEFASGHFRHTFSFVKCGNMINIKIALLLKWSSVDKKSPVIVL